MTPKEKAKELTDKYCPLVTTWDCYWDAPEKEENILADAKKCALICVDEIIEVLTDWDRLNHIDKSTFEYWQEVKQEIINL